MKKKSESLTRRRFLEASILATLSGVAIVITGCGRGAGSDPDGSSPNTGSGGSESGAISANHGHSAILSAARLESGAAVALAIQGSSDHPHEVSLSAAQVNAIAQGSRVSVVSTNVSGHSHTVTFN